MSTAKIAVCLQEPLAPINPNLYGHFAEHLGTCIYEGIWVGEDSPIPHIGGMRKDVVEALKRIHPPIIRWPGGCFADDYHWRDGIGPRASRPRRVNIWWGEVVETNAFGTHEFVQFCRLVGAEPYLCGNVGTGSPQELRDWVEYCNYAGDSSLARERAANGSPEPLGIRYWSVGNENWGCGGNFTPEDYATEFRRFATFLRDFSGAPLFLVACGPASNDPEWTRRFFAKLAGYPQFGASKRIHGFSAHYYCGTAGAATEYSVEQWYQLIRRSLEMEPLIVQQRAIMDGFDPERRIGLIVDEWGTWHPPAEGRNPHFLWQQNTLRDALVAAATLDIFNRHADKIVMGNIAQMINVLQAMILTDGPRMVCTPTYHVYDMYQYHQGATSLRAFFEAEEIAFKANEEEGHLFGLNGSASVKDGVLTLSVVNPHVSEPIEATIELRGGRGLRGTATVLSHADIHAHNTFESPNVLAPRTTLFELEGPEWRHTFPPASVTVLRVPLG